MHHAHPPGLLSPRRPIPDRGNPRDDGGADPADLHQQRQEEVGR